MVAVSVAEDAGGDIERAAELAYGRLITCVRPSEHPYLVRIWNYFSAINEGEGDGERYRRFCVGRARGVDGRFNDPPPAATAIGASRATGRLAGHRALLADARRRPGEPAADAGLALSARVRPGFAGLLERRPARCRQPVAAPARLGHGQHRRPCLPARRRCRRPTGREPGQSRSPAHRGLGERAARIFPGRLRSAARVPAQSGGPADRAARHPGLGVAGGARGVPARRCLPARAVRRTRRRVRRERLVGDFHPDRRMVAGPIPQARLAVDARSHRARAQRLADQHQVDAQARDCGGSRRRGNPTS